MNISILLRYFRKTSNFLTLCSFFLCNFIFDRAIIFTMYIKDFTTIELQLTVGPETCIGEGSTITEAKQKAAFQMLSQIRSALSTATKDLQELLNLNNCKAEFKLLNISRTQDYIPLYTIQVGFIASNYSKIFQQNLKQHIIQISRSLDPTHIPL